MIAARTSPKKRIQYCRQISHALEILSLVVSIMGGCLGCSLIDVMLNYRSLRGTYYYRLNIKEIDHIVFIIKMVRYVS